MVKTNWSNDMYEYEVRYGTHLRHPPYLGRRPIALAEHATCRKIQERSAPEVSPYSFTHMDQNTLDGDRKVLNRECSTRRWFDCTYSLECFILSSPNVVSMMALPPCFLDVFRSQDICSRHMANVCPRSNGQVIPRIIVGIS